MAGILSVGWHLPAERRAAAEIERASALAERAIADFGVRSQTVAGPDDHPSNLAARATQQALSAAGLSPSDIDLLIFCGMTRDYPAPWVAAFAVLHELGATQAAGFDLAARCPGIHEALWVAATLVRAGTFKTVVVATGDRFDVLFDAAVQPVRVTEAVCSAGGAAAVVSAAADNEIVAYTHYTSPHLHFHAQSSPRAGGTRIPLSRETVAENLHLWHNDMKVPDLLALREFFREADRRNLADIRRKAGFDEIDFFIGAPLDLRSFGEFLRNAGLDPDRQTVTTIQELGHAGPADSLHSLASAVAQGLDMGRRLVMMTRTLVYSNAIAIRAGEDGFGIRVAGDPLAHSVKAG